MPCLLYQRVARRCAASSAAALFTVLACPAMADTAPVQDGASPAAQPDYTLVPNIGVASQYRYRGLMQSAGYPAVSGGLDFTHKSGFYLGNWDSTIRWLGNSNGQISAPVETDFYGGYKNSINSDWSYDLGVLRYQYFGNYPSGTVSPNTTELYGALTYKSLTFKYSYATSNLFGATNSQHSQYFDLSDNYDTGVWGLTVNSHIGYQFVRNVAAGSYLDWKLGVTKDMGQGWSAALAYVQTNARHTVYTSPQGQYMGGAAVIASITKTF